jgi:hypothetical protein
MNLILRGHIRNSFENSALHDLMLSVVAKVPDIKVYVHSWNVVQSSASWRGMEENKNKVTPEIISDYLGIGKNLRSVVVEDDGDVCVPGRVTGTVASTPCPIKGYKMMFYGMMRGSELVLEDSDPEELVVQTRFDMLSNWIRMSPERIVDFLDARPGEGEPIRFLIRPGENGRERELRLDRWKRHGSEYEPHWTAGVDNTFMATVKNMNRLLTHMYRRFDEVEAKYKRTNHQEWLLMFESFDPCWLSQP